MHDDGYLQQFCVHVEILSMHAFVSTSHPDHAAQLKRLKKLHMDNGGTDQGRFQLAPKPAWMISREVDLLFVCGLAPWILGGLAWALLGSPMQDMHATFLHRGFTMLYVFSALLIGEGHQFTSILRFHFARRFWKRWKSLPPVVFMWVGFFSVGLGLFSSQFSELNAGLQALAGLGMVLFPIVLVHHFCIQAHAIVLLYCTKSGYLVEKSQLRMFRLATWFLVAGGACAMALPFGLTETDRILENVPQYAIPLMVASLLLVAVPAMVRGRVAREWPPITGVMLWLNLVGFLMMPMQFGAYVWVFVPIFFHASQHWVVAYASRRRETATAKLERSALHDLLRLVLPVQAVSLAVLYMPLLTINLPPGVDAQSASMQPNLTLPVTWSMFVFYLHYFTDRIVWKPR